MHMWPRSRKAASSFNLEKKKKLARWLSTDHAHEQRYTVSYHLEDIHNFSGSEKILRHILSQQDIIIIIITYIATLDIWTHT